MSVFYDFDMLYKNFSVPWYFLHVIFQARVLERVAIAFSGYFYYNIQNETFSIV